MVKVSALKAIASLKSATAIGEARKIINNTQDTGHKKILLKTAIQTIGIIGGPEEVGLLLEYMGNTAYRFEAFNALFNILQKHDVKLDFSSIENRHTRQYACILIGNIENSHNYKSLLECLHDRYPSVQRAAALALSTYESTGVRDFENVISGLNDPSIIKLLLNKKKGRESDF